MFVSKIVSRARENMVSIVKTRMVHRIKKKQSHGVDFLEIEDNKNLMAS